MLFHTPRAPIVIFSLYHLQLTQLVERRPGSCVPVLLLLLRFRRHPALEHARQGEKPRVDSTPGKQYTEVQSDPGVDIKEDCSAGFDNYDSI
jgi:hypothetical protein